MCSIGGICTGSAGGSCLPSVLCTGVSVSSENYRALCVLNAKRELYLVGVNMVRVRSGRGSDPAGVSCIHGTCLAVGTLVYSILDCGVQAFAPPKLFLLGCLLLQW